MIDPNDATWAEVEALAKEQIAEAYAAMRNPAAGIDEVNRMRGRIDAYERVLSLATPGETPRVTDGFPVSY